MIARRGVLAGAAAVWLLAGAYGYAQPLARIGVLSTRSRSDSEGVLAAFYDGLAEAGYVNGRNITADERWAEGRADRLQAEAAALAQSDVRVIAALGNIPSALAVKAANAAMPIVFVSGSDPVKFGLVQSINRPGGNATGVNTFINAMEAKRLELVQELIPAARKIAALVNPASPDANDQVTEMQAATARLGYDLSVLRASNVGEFPGLSSALDQKKPDALMIITDPLFNLHRAELAGMFTTRQVPAIFPWREAAEEGGLASYGANLAESYRQAGRYVGRILDGAEPANLPVLQPSRFELVVNLRTARALGLAVPQSLLLRADAVIE